MELHLDSFPTLHIQTRIVEIFDGRYKLTTEWYLDDNQYVWIKVTDAKNTLILSLQRQGDDVFHHEISVNHREYLLIGIPMHTSILINLSETSIKFSPDNFTWMEGAISPDEKTLIVGGSDEQPRYVFYDISGDKIDRIEGDIIRYLNKEDDNDTFTIARWLDNDKVEISMRDLYYEKLLGTLSDIVSETFDACLEDNEIAYEEACDKLEQLESLPDKLREAKVYERKNDRFREVYDIIVNERC